jgi:hypothetical protein
MPMTHARLLETFGEPAAITNERRNGVIFETAEYPCDCEARRIVFADAVGGWVLYVGCGQHKDRLFAGEFPDGGAGEIGE